VLVSDHSESKTDQEVTQAVTGIYGFANGLFLIIIWQYTAVIPINTKSLTLNVWELEGRDLHWRLLKLAIQRQEHQNCCLAF